MSSTRQLTIEIKFFSPDEIETFLERRVDAFPGDDSRVLEYDENLVWWDRSGGADIEDPSFPSLHRIVRTIYSDTVDSGHGTLYEPSDEGYVAVDTISSPFGDYGGYVFDYFRLNHGIAPRYGYEYLVPDDPGTTDRPEGFADWETFPSRLDPDREFESADAAFDALETDHHASAVRYLATAEIEDTERYDRFLDAVGAADQRTRALVARTLWTPLHTEWDVDWSLVCSFLDLTDDPVPELRVGAFMGASRCLAAALDSGKEVPDELRREFYETYAALLDDPDPRIRERAVRCAREQLTPGDKMDSLALLDDEQWLRIDFPLRWTIVRRSEANVEDDALGSLRLSRGLVADAFDGEPAAVSTLLEYAYDERGSSRNEVVSKLAEATERGRVRPLQALDHVLSVVESGDAEPADLRLLAALTPERPGDVAPVAPALAAILREAAGTDNGEDNDADAAAAKQMAAARALGRLPPNTRTGDRETLASAAIDAVDRYSDGRDIPYCVGTVASIDADRAAEWLVGLSDGVDPVTGTDIRRGKIDTAIEAASAGDPAAVASALDDLTPVLTGAPEVSPSLATAIARTARASPHVVADHVDELTTWLGHPSSLVREAATTALIAVDQGSDTLPDEFEGLLARSEDALAVETFAAELDRDDRIVETPADWPLGTLISAPETLAESVIACIGEDFADPESLAGLVREVWAGDPTVAKRLLRAILNQRFVETLPTYRDEGPFELLAETDLVIVASVIDDIVNALSNVETVAADSDLSVDTVYSRSDTVERAVQVVVTERPDEAKAAIESQYGSVIGFYHDRRSDVREDICNQLL